MSSESDLIARLQALATHPAARGLKDDVAVLTPPIGRDLVLTHDVLVEGVHYLPDDPAGDVAWKLVAVNLSDLASKGAEPLGVLMGFTLAGDAAWDTAFVDGLRRALSHFGVSLLGGDTVSARGARVLGLTAIGQVPSGVAPSRTGAQPGDELWVTGTIGDAGLGLKIARGELPLQPRLLKRYRLPMPRLSFGKAVAPMVSAMMDVSDGVLIDASRMARASNAAIGIRLEDVPLSADGVEMTGDNQAVRLAAVTAGDDYELLFAAAPECRSAIESLAEAHRLPVSRIGSVTTGSGLTLCDKAENISLPDVLGWEHGQSK